MNRELRWKTYVVWKVEVVNGPILNFSLTRKSCFRGFLSYSLSQKEILRKWFENYCHHIITDNHIWYMNTFRGWQVLWKKTTDPAPEFTFTKIFSGLAKLFTTGFTYEGKQKGTLRQNCPSWYNNFWDHLTLIDKTVPPQTWK